MTYTGISNKVAVSCGKPTNEVQKILKAYFEVVKAALLAGEEVHIGTGRNFHNGLNLGRLVPIEHKPRKGRNPHTGEVIDIPTAKVVKFLTSKNLKAALNNAAGDNAE